MTFRVTGKTFVRFVPREQAARWSPPSLSAPSSHGSLVSFFLATGFRWQASISQNSITWHESVHPVMGSARGISSRSAKTRSSPNFSYYVLVLWKKGMKKVWRMCTAVPKGIARPNDKSWLHRYHARQLNSMIDHVLKAKSEGTFRSNSLEMIFRGKIPRILRKLGWMKLHVSTERRFGRKCVSFHQLLREFPDAWRERAVGFASLGFPLSTDLDRDEQPRRQWNCIKLRRGMTHWYILREAAMMAE